MTKILSVISYQLFHTIRIKSPKISEEVECDIYSTRDTTFCLPCHAISRLTRKRVI